LLILAAVVAIFVYGMTAPCWGRSCGAVQPLSAHASANGTIALAQALGLMVASLGVGPLLDDFGKKAV